MLLRVVVPRRARRAAAPARTLSRHGPCRPAGVCSVSPSLASRRLLR